MKKDLQNYLEKIDTILKKEFKYKRYTAKIIRFLSQINIEKCFNYI